MKKIIAGLLCLTSLFCVTACKKNDKCVYTETDTCMRFTDYSYGKAKERNLLDLALPKTQNVQGLVLLIHGGAWMAGDKNGYGNELENWCQKGYAAAAVNYRYINKKTHCEDLLDDIDGALKKIKSLAKEKGITLTKLLTMGHSAGGHLSLQYSYTRADTAPITPAVAVSLSGPADMTDEYYWQENATFRANYDEWFSYLSGVAVTPKKLQDATAHLQNVSPIYFVTEQTVPTILCHGKLDDLVPISNVERLERVLTEKSVKHEFFVYENSGHGLENDGAIHAEYTAVLDAYAAEYLK